MQGTKNNVISMNNFSLKVYLRVSKPNKKEEAPIYIRVMGNGQSSDVCSGPLIQLLVEFQFSSLIYIP